MGWQAEGDGVAMGPTKAYVDRSLSQLLSWLKTTPSHDVSKALVCVCLSNNKRQFVTDNHTERGQWENAW